MTVIKIGLELEVNVFLQFILFVLFISFVHSVKHTFGVVLPSHVCDRHTSPDLIFHTCPTSAIIYQQW